MQGDDSLSSWQLWLLRNCQLGRNARTLRSPHTFGLFVEGIQNTNPAQRAAMRSSCYNMFRIECQLSGLRDPGEEVYDMMHRGWVWFPDESGIDGPFDGR